MNRRFLLPSRLSPTVSGSAVAAVVVLLVTQAFPHKVPLGTVAYGVVYGSLNGLLAIGLVLIFRVTRSINFGYGAMGGLPAGIAASLYLSHHTPWAVCIALAVALGGLVGAGVGALINWRFSRSPRLVLTVATIGLSQLLGGLGLYVPKWFHGPALIPSFRTGLSSFHTQIRPVLFNGNDLVALVTVPVIVTATSWFLLRTHSGRAVRAIADNPERARLVGVPARRLMLIVWSVAGVVAALAVVLQAPTAGVPLDAAAGPAILLPPLAAAVVARMSSLPGAFVAGIGLGVLEAVIRLDVSKQAIETPLFLAVILVSLLVQHRTESRAEAADEGSWSAVGALKPIPAALKRLPEIRAARAVLAAGLAVLALALPSMLSPGRLQQATVGLVLATAAISLVVLSGWSGTVSLGQMALVGIGSVVAGDLMMHLNLDFFLSLAGACGAGAVAAVVLGLPALRVRGLYLAVTTLAFAVAANDFFYNPTNFGAELPGRVPAPVLWKRFPLSGQADLYFLCLGLLILCAVVCRSLRSARPGRAILATRDNLRSAQAAAVPATRTRLMAFVLSGAIAGVAGAMYVVILGGVGYQTFQPADSITVFSMVVIGGASSIAGSLAGVGLIQWIGIEFPQAQLVLTGVGLLVVLMIFPAGLVGLYERLRDRALAAVARRRAIDTSAWSGGGAVVGDATGELPTVEAVTGRRDDPDVLLSCTSVDAAYGSMQVLFGVDLEVKRGEIVALLGTNGAGKSSLLRAMTGLLPARSGRVTFLGRDVTSAATEEIAARGLTMMPGGRGVFGTLTVDENLRVAGWPLRKDPDAAARAIADAVALFPVLEDRSNILAGDLSGGEQQMLSLAMALLVQPELLCIDELSLGLAPTVVGKLLDAVRRIHARGVTIVIVEQSVNVALLLAERATFMEKGRVRFSGPARDILDRPDLLRAVFIGGETNGKVDHVPAARAKISVRTKRAKTAASAVAEPALPALRCEGLVKRFGGVTAVNHVDLAVGRGEIVGLIGHNGAGKTTLFDMISGFIAMDGGRLWLGENEVTEYRAWERALIGLGRSFQEARLYPSLTVAETIAVAFDRHLPNRDPFAAAFNLLASTDSESALGERVDELVARFGLAAYRNRPTGELSTGTRRIVELACVSAQSPSMMLLDEPSGGVAQRETEALGPLLRQVVDDTGCSMVVIEHDMGLLSRLCDRLVALELGAIIAEGPPAEVLAHPAVIASYLGTDEAAVARSGTMAGSRAGSRAGSAAGGRMPR